MRRLALSTDEGTAEAARLPDIAQWLEALGLRAWIPGRSFRAPDPASLLKALPGIAVPAVRHVYTGGEGADGSHGLDRATDELVAPEPAARTRAIERLVATARLAAATRSSLVIVEPCGSDSDPGLPGGSGDARARERDEVALLDRLCRALHEAGRQVEGPSFALATPRGRTPWLTVEGIAHVFEDLGPRRRLAYWHDSGRARALAARGFCPESRWLDRHASRCAGLDATDAIGEHAGLPAGAGEVDFQALLGAIPSAAWVTLRSEPFSGPGPLHAAVRRLQSKELR